jgi:hypothetical protein
MVKMPVRSKEYFNYIYVLFILHVNHKKLRKIMLIIVGHHPGILHGVWHCCDHIGPCQHLNSGDIKILVCRFY